MITKRFPITFEEVKDMFTRLHKTEWFALLYDEHGGQQGNIVDNEGNIVYVNEHHIYEQIEFFDNINTLNNRIEELKRITNKSYSNFRILIREHYV
jgi:hypothetical protein